VQSIFEWGDEKAILVSGKDDLENIHFENTEKIVVLSQTTQNMDFVQEVFEFVKNKYPMVEIADTICLATEQRQSEIKKMAEESDAVVVIGSPESANSNRLHEIAKGLNGKAIFIERAEDLPGKEFFTGLDQVVVTAGVSTPYWIIEEVMSRLAEL